MSDKERLEYIEEQVQELLTLADSEGCGEANLLAIHNDMIWLIEQAEKVERYEKALKEIKNDIETDYTQEEIALGEMTSLLTVIYEQVKQALEGSE